ANAPGIDDLAGIATGKPAIVVSAGPSLRRNIDLLSQPGVRDRVVIIAVQTVLKTLLAKGIRPHFVTALDHASISKRFYEGLTAADVEGVTLVVEPKASPAIFEAWPGAIRCPAERIADSILTDNADDSIRGVFKRDRGELRPGATVAHLAYYLARHMGADPVILIGQDLGFTDGQYYAAGAAIHQVWSGELSHFRTLEMLEWERIARERSMLHRLTDHLGRPCYSDEQMTTYLVQFERDFGEDVNRGLKVIDATEGGISKRHAKA
ncbi:MAG: motility associated factor glycosyltransferase family protein, partial [Phycisphaerae bacterium]